MTAAIAQVEAWLRAIVREEVSAALAARSDPWIFTAEEARLSGRQWGAAVRAIGVKVGGRWRARRSALDAWLVRGAAVPPAAEDAEGFLERCGFNAK